jgi:hypothetical protein
MAESPEQNAVLQNLIALTLTLCDRFKHTPLRFAHTFAIWKTQTQQVKRNSGNIVTNLLLDFIRCSWFLSAHFLYGSAPQNEIAWIKVGTSQRSFCWSSTPSRPATKMTVKPHTASMWRCSILHEVQFFIRFALRNNKKPETVTDIALCIHILQNDCVEFCDLI